MSGPLDGVRVVELGGIGPGPMCGMLLADLGADVIRVERLEPIDLGIGGERRFEVLLRGRRSIAADLKTQEGAEIVLRLVERSDALIEGFRPGVAERLGLGPDDCLSRNPRLVYGRMTGFGQDGPLAGAAGHDIAYIALSGALDAIGPRGGPPVPPLNLVGDFGGGALYLAMGLCAGLVEARSSGQGQVVDAAMVDGAASLMTAIYGLRAAGMWSEKRGTNLLDGGAPFYGTYRCGDGRWIAIGPLEQRFFDELVDRLGISPGDVPNRHDPSEWPALRDLLERTFEQKDRDEWVSQLEGTDVCFAPVLTMAEAPHHPHNVAREVFLEVDGVLQPAPAPRFSRTPAAVAGPVPEIGRDTLDVLRECGWADAEIDSLLARDIIGT